MIKKICIFVKTMQHFQFMLENKVQTQNDLKSNNWGRLCSKRNWDTFSNFIWHEYEYDCLEKNKLMQKMFYGI